MDELFDLPTADTRPAEADRRGRPRLQRPQRDQITLRPSDLESLLPADHEARLVWAFVESRDLSGFHAWIRAVEGHPGRPPIDPAILVALWLYATLEGVGSARALDRLCDEHDAYRWIAGGVSVNYHTLAEFRVTEADLLEDLLVGSVAALIVTGEVTLRRVAHDGIRVRASAGAASFRRRPRLEAALADAEAQVAALRDELDDDPGATSRRVAAARERATREREARVREALAALPELEAAKERARARGKKDRPVAPARVSTTDPEARIMRMGDNGFRPAFNGQLTTDVDSGLVCGVAVTNRGTDHVELVPLVRRLERAFGVRPQEILVDGGFVVLDDIEALEASGTAVYAPPPEHRGCGEAIPRRRPDGPGVAAWRERMGTDAAKATYRLRAATAEWTNALARNRGLHQFRVRGLARARAVLLWFALAHCDDGLVASAGRV
jgi:transposase